MAAELGNRLAIVLRIRPWGWHRRVPPERLRARVDGAYRAGPFRALWSVEALGYRYAAAAPGFRRGDPPPRLPSDELPPECLLMLHVGVGMALARRALAAARDRTEAGAAARRFLDDFDLVAVPGFHAAAAEALGVAVRFGHRRLVDAVAGELAASARDLVPWYWHGVGRCQLFLPSSFLPLPEASWRSARRLAREVPAGAPRRHARVGWACGVVLVHLRQPWAVADLLRRHGAEIEADGDGFADDLRAGVVEAVDVRREVTPGGDDLLEAFLADPPAGDVQTAERWRRLIEEPGREALIPPVAARRR